MNKMKAFRIGITSVLGAAVVWKAYNNVIELACYKTLTNQDLAVREDADYLITMLNVRQMQLHEERDLGNISYFEYMMEMTKASKDYQIKSLYELVDRE